MPGCSSFFSSINPLGCVRHCPADWAREHRGAKQSFLRQVTSKLDHPLDTTRCAGDGTVRRRWQGMSRGTPQLKSSVILTALQCEKYIKITYEPAGFPLIKSGAGFWIIKSQRSIGGSELASGDDCIASDWRGGRGEGTVLRCLGSEVAAPGSAGQTQAQMSSRCWEVLF